MFFERPDSGEIAVVVHIDFNDQSESYGPEEFVELAMSAGADPVAVVTGSRQRPDAKYFVGTDMVDNS